MNQTINTRTAIRSFESLEDLTERGDSAAIFTKLLRRQEYGQGVERAAKFLVDCVAEDLSLLTTQEVVRFGDIVFAKSDKSVFERYDFNDRDRTHPYLDVHFWPRQGKSLRKAKDSMAAASEWLSEVADEYPLVYGCTYQELAAVALKFGFEDVIIEDDMWISSRHKNRITLAHTVFGILNNTAGQPAEVVGVVANTEYLAEEWSRYR